MTFACAWDLKQYLLFHWNEVLYCHPWPTMLPTSWRSNSYNKYKMSNRLRREIRKIYKSYYVNHGITFKDNLSTLPSLEKHQFIQYLHVFFIRKLVRGLGLNFLNFFRHFGSKTFLMLSYYKFGQGTRYGKSAFSYCFVDAAPPKPLKIGDFGAKNRVFWIWKAGMHILYIESSGFLKLIVSNFLRVGAL